MKNQDYWLVKIINVQYIPVILPCTGYKLDDRSKEEESTVKG